jgi:hypothetical protein
MGWLAEIHIIGPILPGYPLWPETVSFRSRGNHLLIVGVGVDGVQFGVREGPWMHIVM